MFSLIIVLNTLNDLRSEQFVSSIFEYVSFYINDSTNFNVREESRPFITTTIYLFADVSCITKNIMNYISKL